MLTLQKLTPASPALDAARALYERSFPLNERREFDDMLLDASGICDLISLLDDGRWVGFACILNCIGIAHIIYFAIEETHRGHGLGTAALKSMHDLCAPARVIVDIERVGPHDAQNAQRARRKDFYLRCGYRENPVYYRWQEEDYEVLSYGGAITAQEFSAFWKEAYAKNPLIG